MSRKSDAYVVPLGVSGALVDEHYHNSYLAVARGERFWLVDCAGSPIAQLKRAGLNPANVQGIIITHFHPDHVYGLPGFLLGLYVQNNQKKTPRQAPLPIYARPEVLGKVRSLVQIFDRQDWVYALPLEYHPVVAEIGALVEEDHLFRVTATPTRHSIFSLALRFETRQRNGVFVYSSDTKPCFEVEQLARYATLLFHESAGDGHGHSKPRDVGALATRSQVERLVLIHYPLDHTAETLFEARATFAGPLELAEELKSYYF
jgi:ribonuclease Z